MQREVLSKMSLATSKSTGNVLNLQNVYQQEPINALRKSHSTSSCVVINKRGFKPSDRYDPHKREFLTTLTHKLWHISLVCNNLHIYRFICIISHWLHTLTH
jgi:hypothetical protein